MVDKNFGNNASPIVVPPKHGILLPRRFEGMQALNAALQSNATKFQNVTSTVGIEQVWQPSQIVSAANIEAIRLEARLLSKAFMTIGVGSKWTEGGLANFAASFASVLGALGMIVDDASREPMVRWLNMWNGEEAKHDKVLSAWLPATCRLEDGGQDIVERSEQQYLSDGLSLNIHGDVFAGVLFVALQEAMTHRSHYLMGQIAKETNAPITANLFGTIAADEAGHATTYKNFAQVFFNTAPNEMMETLYQILKKGFVMPGNTIMVVEPGKAMTPALATIQAANQELGILTNEQLTDILGTLLKYWHIAEQVGGVWQSTNYYDEQLNDKGKKIQNRIVRQLNLMEKFSKRIKDEPKSGVRRPEAFSSFEWIRAPSGK